MDPSARFRLGLVALFVVVVAAGRAVGLGMEEFGPAGEHLGRQADWPNGVEDVLRHSARVYWFWVNGSERAYYDGDIKAVNELLALYSKIDLAEHPVVIVAGRPSAKSFHGKLTPFNVAFDFPGRIETHLRRQTGTTSLFPLTPQLVVFADAKLAEELQALKIPENVTLQPSPLRTEAALDRISAKRDAVDPALDERITKFVEGHPQRARGSDD